MKTKRIEGLVRKAILSKTKDESARKVVYSVSVPEGNIERTLIKSGITIIEEHQTNLSEKYNKLLSDYNARGKEIRSLLNKNTNLNEELNRKSEIANDFEYAYEKKLEELIRKTEVANNINSNYNKSIEEIHNLKITNKQLNLTNSSLNSQLAKANKSMPIELVIKDVRDFLRNSTKEGLFSVSCEGLYEYYKTSRNHMYYLPELETFDAIMLQFGYCTVVDDDNSWFGLTVVQ